LRYLLKGDTEICLGIPYLKRLGGRDGKTPEGEIKKEKPHGKAEYAQAGRDALQQYLVDLIRSVVSSAYHISARITTTSSWRETPDSIEG